MLLNLKSAVRYQEMQKRDVILEQRLPVFIQPPCSVSYEYQVQEEKDYFLLNMRLQGRLTLICQRCLGEFSHHYDNQTVIALCDSDKVADHLMSDYECVVVSNGKVALDELIIDELYLYAPQKHKHREECSLQTPLYDVPE